MAARQMTILHDIFRGASTNLVHWLPFLATLLVAVGALLVARWLLFAKRIGRVAQTTLVRQLIMLALTAVAVVALVVAMPIGDTSRGQLLGLIGLVLTGVIGLSSTTFVGNAMAGLMLRAVRAFHPGDFLKTMDHFGRVTERGLLHTEIQTEDRDLTTLPNLYLVTNPVTVVRFSGTIVSATVSLGYDVAHARIEEVLLEAARAAELQEPFVQILELGDFSVHYRVAGFLSEVKYLLSVRSRLRACMLDALHGAGIEIVSPTFMNQRQLAPDRRFIPRPSGVHAAPLEGARPAPEEIMFDKAELAESREQLNERLQAIGEQIKALHQRTSTAPDETARAAIKQQVGQLEARRDAVTAAIAQFDQDKARGDAPVLPPTPVGRRDG
jgi:small conductance mechanosensitive channel